MGDEKILETFDPIFGDDLSTFKDPKSNVTCFVPTVIAIKGEFLLVFLFVQTFERVPRRYESLAGEVIHITRAVWLDYLLHSWEPLSKINTNDRPEEQEMDHN